MIEQSAAGLGVYVLKRNTKLLAALLLVLEITVAPVDAAQRSSKKAEPPPPPPQFRVDVATRTMALARVVSSLPTGSTIGKLSWGCFLLDAVKGPPVMLHPDNAFTSTSAQDAAALFHAEADAAGYRLADAQKGNLFEAQNVTQPELQVGAAVIGLTANGCFGQVLGVRTAEFEATITVDWQVFEPLEKKIIFRSTNSGKATIKQNQFSDTVVVEATGNAFREAAKAILSDPNFVMAVKDPNGGASNASSGALFPEATTATSGGAVSGQEKTRIAALPLQTKTFREQVESIKQQVVTIRTPNGTGSGFYISDGLLLTNTHVVSGFKKVMVRFFGGREIVADVLSSDARRDVALLKTESVGLSGLSLRLDKPELTSQVFVIGSPLGEKQEGSISAGIISGYRDNELGPMIQSDVAVTHGNSGGPLLDEKGNVIGLTNLVLLGSDGGPTAIGLFIPISDALGKLGITVGAGN
jgi:serine protease Do